MPGVSFTLDDAGRVRPALDRLGTIVGSVMVVGGLALAMFGGNLGGIWFVAIGWFLRDAALAELESMRVMQTMHRYTARDVMSPVPHTVPFDLTIREFVAFADLHGRHAYYPVLEESVLVGLASIAAVGAHEPERWDEMSIGGLVQPIGYCVVVDADIALDDLLTQLAGRDETRALVVEDGELVGIVAPSDVARLATGPFAEARVSRTTRSAAPAGP